IAADRQEIGKPEGVGQQNRRSLLNHKDISTGAHFAHTRRAASSVNSLILLAPQVGFEPTTLRLTAECSTVELLRSKCVISLKQTRTCTVKSSHSAVPDAGAGSPPCLPACPSAPPPAPPRPLRSPPPPRLPSSSRTPSRRAPSPGGSRSTEHSRSSPRHRPLQSSSLPKRIPRSPALPAPPLSSPRSSPGTPLHADSESRTNRSP